MPGVGNDGKLRGGDELAEGAAVVGGNDSILLAPNEQSRDADAMQAVFQLGIVHVRIPAEAREALDVTRDGAELFFRHGGEVSLAFFGVGPFETRDLVGMQSPD